MGKGFFCSSEVQAIRQLNTCVMKIDHFKGIDILPRKFEGAPKIGTLRILLLKEFEMCLHLTKDQVRKCFVRITTWSCIECIDN